MTKTELAETRVPPDLRKVLTGDTLVRWNSLTPLARRDFILWIDQAKQLETRKRRVDSIPSRLASGKRRPCCFAVVPMPLYKALGADSKAKATWSSLTSDERRDFVDFVESAKDTAARKHLIEETCKTLAKGKRHP